MYNIVWVRWQGCARTPIYPIKFPSHHKTLNVKLLLVCKVNIFRRKLKLMWAGEGSYGVLAHLVKGFQWHTKYLFAWLRSYDRHKTSILMANFWGGQHCLNFIYGHHWQKIDGEQTNDEFLVVVIKNDSWRPLAASAVIYKTIHYKVCIYMLWVCEASQPLSCHCIFNFGRNIKIKLFWK